MGHPEIDNRTPFAFTPLFVSDEDGRPIVSTIVKATFDVSRRGVVTIAEKQEEVDFAGKHNGAPGKSSVRIEPEVAFIKPATDCVLLGHATSSIPATIVDVTFAVGPMYKTARVTGDRWWTEGALGLAMTSPVPFERIPLVYERAFGGWDLTSEKPEHHEAEPRNPAGVGFVGRHGTCMPGTPVPNIEDPLDPQTSAGGRCQPVGFGFVGCEWQPRAQYAGTYDEKWTKDRSPLLPTDFDRRFFNGASDGLIALGYLNGDEMVVAMGVTPEGRWDFRLPGVHAPRCTVAVRYGDSLTLQTNLDTAIVDADARRLTLLWRAFTPLRSGPHDVSAIRIESTNVARQLEATPPAGALATVS